ncbi:hypothetical protein HNY73_015387 [Argiope bruennichi]|uniref:IRF tryptophan pentad repeat domain-containing protein n=1 Tax=Argiope bruennichi TaxID=94029 RepID=A0A8T0ESG5_ARGBR|nr:hypothetical protein HNY73_015387 [Argiope bruennichi]
MPTLLENFLISSLNENSFGHLLSWVDEGNGILKVFWQHKNSNQWKEDFAVFKAWDAMKGRMPTETNVKYLTQAKRRFRAAMLKHNSLKLLKSSEKFGYCQILNRTMPEKMLIEKFLIPSLEGDTFKHLLTWVNRNEGIIKLFCQHKNSSRWKEDFQVFKAWDLLKGRKTTTNDKKYFTDSKHRFLTAMRKHSCVKSSGKIQIFQTCQS